MNKGVPLKALGALGWMGMVASAQELPKLLTVKQVAELLGMHPKTIYDWRYKGKLVGYKLGCNVMYDRDDITRWLASRKEDSDAEATERDVP